MHPLKVRILNSKDVLYHVTNGCITWTLPGEGVHHACIDRVLMPGIQKGTLLLVTIRTHFYDVF